MTEGPEFRTPAENTQRAIMLTCFFVGTSPQNTPDRRAEPMFQRLKTQTLRRIDLWQLKSSLIQTNCCMVSPEHVHARATKSASSEMQCSSLVHAFKLRSIAFECDTVGI